MRAGRWTTSVLIGGTRGRAQVSQSKVVASQRYYCGPAAQCAMDPPETNISGAEDSSQAATRGDVVLDLVRLSPLSTPPAWQVVAESLRRKILAGLYRPGDLLPSERQLSDELGVSRITVREAIRVLQGERLLEIRRSNAGGAQVLAPRGRPIAEIREEMRRDLDRFESILDCRIANEALAARLAARRHEPDQIRSLERTLPAMAEASRGLSAEGRSEEARTAAAVEFRHQDSVFHLTLAAIPGNEYLFQIVEWLRAEFFTPLDTITRSRNQQDSAGEHRRILEAVRSGDEALAAEAMVQHLEATRRSMQRLLEDGGLPPA